MCTQPLPTCFQGCCCFIDICLHCCLGLQCILALSGKRLQLALTPLLLLLSGSQRSLLLCQL